MFVWYTNTAGNEAYTVINIKKSLIIALLQSEDVASYFW